MRLFSLEMGEAKEGLAVQRSSCFARLELTDWAVQAEQSPKEYRVTNPSFKELIVP